MSSHWFTRALLLTGIAVGLSACVATRPSTRNSRFNSEFSPQIGYAATHADTRLAYFKPTDGSGFCAEPMPDALREETFRLLADMKHKGSVTIKARDRVEVSVGTDDQRRLELERAQLMREMAGRNDRVLVARELMYRLCELNLNRGAKGTEFESILDAYKLIALGIVQQARAEAFAAEEAEELARAELLRLELAAHPESSAVRLLTDYIVGRFTAAPAGCGAKPLDAALLAQAKKAAPDLDALVALPEATTCAQLKDYLSAYPAAVLRQIADALSAPAAIGEAKPDPAPPPADGKPGAPKKTSPSDKP